VPSAALLDPAAAEAARVGHARDLLHGATDRLGAEMGIAPTMLRAVVGALFSLLPTGTRLGRKTASGGAVAALSEGEANALGHQLFAEATMTGALDSLLGPARPPELAAVAPPRALPPRPGPHRALPAPNACVLCLHPAGWHDPLMGRCSPPSGLICSCGRPTPTKGPRR
jgi:hypothetical protein